MTWYNAGDAQKSANQQTYDGDGVEETWCAAESWLDSVHDPRAGASHPSLQESSDWPETSARLMELFT